MTTKPFAPGVHNGVVDGGAELLGKPFTVDELAARVREVLDALG